MSMTKYVAVQQPKKKEDTCDDPNQSQCKQSILSTNRECERASRRNGVLCDLSFVTNALFVKFQAVFITAV